MPSLDPLRPHLYAGYVTRWSDGRWAILRALAEGRNPGGQAEAAVTAALCAVDGPVGRAIANIILEHAGQAAHPAAEMIKPGEYAVLRGRRSPDIGVRDAASGRLLLAGECKRYAHINGGFGYCPLDPGGYSNQVICYQHGCWAYPGALAGAGLLWLHPSDTPPWGDGLHEGLLANPNWVSYAGGDPGRLRRWIDTQHAAAGRWHTAVWEDMVPRFRDLHEPAADVVATLIGTWLGR
jgi:hypothetical protein